MIKTINIIITEHLFKKYISDKKNGYFQLNLLFELSDYLLSILKKIYHLINLKQLIFFIKILS